MKIFILILLINIVSVVNAKINRVYHPYVVPLEKELEYRSLYQETDGSSDMQILQLLGYGQSINETLFLEFYIVSEQAENESAEISAYEAEALIQLTEQGEYWADYGLIFELEKITAIDKWELKSGILVEKEWGKWSTTLNFFTVYEFGEDYENEWHTAAAFQWRYRYSQFIEPSLEVYSSEHGASIGPALSGQIKFSQKKINWEFGLQLGIDSDAPDSYWRALVELEF